MQPSVVFFDGLCIFCNRVVNFIIERDPESRFRFAPLQGKTGQAVLHCDHRAGAAMNTVILVEGDKVFTRSTAALRIARRLRRPWPLLAVFFLVPAPVRDAVYRIIAANRYRWFGRLEACRVPEPEERERFLD